MRSHTGAKPFKCKWCTKRYSHYSGNFIDFNKKTSKNDDFLLKSRNRYETPFILSHR